jgi:phosphatidylserine decarboxylase
MSVLGPQCCTAIQTSGKFFVCELKPGHRSAHWDAGQKVSWDDKKIVQMIPMESK